VGCLSPGICYKSLYELYRGLTREIIANYKAAHQLGLKGREAIAKDVMIDILNKLQPPLRIATTLDIKIFH